MARNFAILGLLAAIIALPFIFRQPPPQGEWRAGDPVIVIVSPHNEAIRYEFAQAFARWHKQKYGKPVKIDWRNIGGTTEISRYLASEYTAATKSWWTAQGKTWPGNATDDLTKTAAPADAGSADVYKTYRDTDAPDAITCKIDLFFGGGEFDHTNAFRSGFAVAVEKELPPELFKKDGVDLIPATLSGEVWRSPSVMGNVVSTFGIIYNVDRLKDLNVATPPSQWTDLADYRYYRQVGLADPTKSGSIAKAFEMIVHQQMHDAVVEFYSSPRSRIILPGVLDAEIAANEKRIAEYIKEKGKAYQRGDVPDDLKAYQAALEKGFANGLNLIQKIGANARYFTDSASKVPIDVSMGDATVGMAIDFYGRYQAQATRSDDGTERMKFVTPLGGTSVSVDPISLLRGAGGSAGGKDETERKANQKAARDAAVRFIEFVLSEEGQKLWTYKPGTKNDQGELIGPEKYTLRRLPIRRTFYPSTQPAIDALSKEHQKHAADDLADPLIDPYAVAKSFVYYKRWTGEHFGVLREIVRAMCMDSADELKDAWARMHYNASDTGTPKAPSAESLAIFSALPTITIKNKGGEEKTIPLTWRTAPDFNNKTFDNIVYMRAWTQAFRDQYRRISE